MKILMCRPDFFAIEYEINPWMKVAQKANLSMAVSQWETLYQTLLQCGALVELVEPEAGLPDMTFTANAGLFYQNKMILAHFKFKQPPGEQPFFLNWFQQRGFEVINLPRPLRQDTVFEGAGDALLLGDTLFAGYGFRTDRAFYEQASYLNQQKIVYCELSNPYFYHLDTCFCPINDTTAIWYPAAFTKASQQAMAKHAELIAVEETEAKHFACNAIAVNHHIIMPTDCPVISAKLKTLGYTVHHCDMREYLKAGGACKCLTLRID